MPTALASRDDFITPDGFKPGDRVRFANGPTMVVVELMENNCAGCYWWVDGVDLHQGVFPISLLIHDQTFPVVEEIPAVTEIAGDAIDDANEGEAYSIDTGTVRILIVPKAAASDASESNN